MGDEQVAAICAALMYASEAGRSDGESFAEHFDTVMQVLRRPTPESR